MNKEENHQARKVKKGLAIHTSQMIAAAQRRYKPDLVENHITLAALSSLVSFVVKSVIFDHRVICVKLMKYKTLDHVVKLDLDKDESIVSYDF